MFPLWRSSYTVLDPLFLEFREFFYATLQEPHAALTLTLTLRQEHSPYSFRFRWPFQAELCPLSGGRVRLIPISAALLGQCRRIFGSFLSLSSPPFGRPILGFFTHLGSLFRQHVNADCEFLALFRPMENEFVAIVLKGAKRIVGKPQSRTLCRPKWPRKSRSCLGLVQI